MVDLREDEQVLGTTCSEEEDHDGCPRWNEADYRTKETSAQKNP